ncbi:MAG TPA: 2-amino-4-hydroxy-6-hydroxymethyldihydropteridine diphosphokinase [Bryobacteraceae bacterium]|nr:2-amino-4-hydroxy-6-hydroxymethyldihydropteridine diphosphokinase [Bryobacteraceae bacterium]
MKHAFLSLGSNLGDREAHLLDALDRLEAAGIHTLRRSSIYETEPQDLPNQPWFLNLVVEVETELFPRLLLARAQAIELGMGRRRVVSKGPRTIDIDILLVGNYVIRTRELQVPHPRISERRFVLEPLAELAPDLRHPATGKTVREMLSEVQAQIVKAWQPKPAD